MGVRPRLWLLAPVVFLWVVDVGLTLTGQPDGYWSGEYSLAHEGNALVRLALARGPVPFVGLTTAILVLEGAFVLAWWQPFATWLAIGAAVAHALGCASWLVRLGPWGWPFAVAFLAVAAEGSAWCWRQAQPGGRLSGPVPGVPVDPHLPPARKHG